MYINGLGIEANYNFGKLRDSYFLSDVPNTEVIMIGRGKTSSMATTDFVYYKGYIDDLRIYDRALTLEEIKVLQNTTNTNIGTCNINQVSSCDAR